MPVQIRRASSNDTEALIRVALSAWAPVFASFRQVLGPKVYGLVYPDWQAQQRDVVTKVCAQREDVAVWVADIDGTVAGFIAYSLDGTNETGTVELLAVDPDYQNGGIGTDLNLFALARMKESGMKVASLSTGGDPGHAPARRAYEKAGYTAFPIVWYYKDL
ncbi:MAG TPA: GNAT family N-acetyltransferase [Thermomicrobiales bacterium]|nr:GNAT family N-acetyltransferase [Thermomicrobiales bacterium]